MSGPVLWTVLRWYWYRATNQRARTGWITFEGVSCRVIVESATTLTIVGKSPFRNKHP